MNKAEQLRWIYEANIACGDTCEAAQARMLADIAAAEYRSGHEGPRNHDREA